MVHLKYNVVTRPYRNQFFDLVHMVLMLIIFTTAFQINDMFGLQSEVKGFSLKAVGEVSEK